VQLGANLGLIVLVVLWGSQIPIMSDLLHRWDPYAINAIRFPISAGLLLVLVRLFEGRWQWPSRALVARLVILGLAITIFATLYILGLSMLNPVTAAVFGSAQPVVAAIVGWAAYRTRLERVVIPAILAALIGGILASVRLRDMSWPGLNVGALFVVAATAAWSWYSLTAQRWLTGLSQLRISAFSIAAASPPMAAVWLAFGAFGLSTLHLPVLVPRDTALLFWVTVGGGGCGILLWNFGVRHVGVVTAAMFLNLMPGAAILTAMGFGIEPSLEQLAGTLLVTGGILYAQLSTRRRLGPDAARR
jgi:drug/metabolite transporter (DMT)-like permease